MVKVKLIGGLGNNMFQYSLGRILAEQLECNLYVEGIEKLEAYFPNVCNITDKKDFSGEVMNLGYNSPQKTIQNFDIHSCFNHTGPILLEGFFQRISFYENHLPKITKWFSYDDSSYFKPNKNDLVLHYRLGDYLSLNWHLLPQSFFHIIEKNELSFDTCYIITDQPNSFLLDPFRHLSQFKIVSQTELGDFTLIKESKRLILSQSTFSWWGSFIGNQEKVYVPIHRSSSNPWKVDPGYDDIDLIPKNNDKYIVDIL